MSKASSINYQLKSAGYKDIERTKSDILNATRNHKSLDVKTERYAYPNGLVKNLVCLDGTIPVMFRGHSYNIPVCIYISENHPFEAPLCYVRPTHDMTIKTSQHVDGSGRVYLPYLSEWRRDTSDLIGVIHVMQVIFGNSCPVYQKTADYDYNTRANPVMPPPLPISQHPPINGPAGSSMSISTPPSNVYPFSSNPYPSANTNGNTITGQHIRASLLSAVEDKLKLRYRERVHQLQDEIEVLKRTSNDLDRGKKQLDDMKERMTRELQELSEAKSKLEELDIQFKEFIERYDGEADNINPDEVYGPTQPLYKQLLDAFAEENAVIDAIYYTGEGLRKGVISLDVYLKSVRELTRRQFMLRALMQACRAKASLPT